MVGTISIPLVIIPTTNNNITMNILIVTWTGDQDSIKRVSDYIEAHGGTVYLFNTDLYPTDVMMSAKYIDGKRKFILKSADFELDLADIDAVWNRRTRMGSKLPKDLDKQMLKASVDEARETLAGMLSSMGVFCMDPYEKLRYAANKQLQLQLAEQVGIEIPKSIFTNDAEEVEQFYKEVNAPLITKMQNTFVFYEEGQQRLFYTSEVSEEQLQQVEGVEICPMIFQERIDISGGADSEIVKWCAGQRKVVEN